MTKSIHILLAVLILVGCRTKSKSVTAETTRRSDSVAAINGITTRSVDRLEVWETVIMMQDSFGRLSPVRHDIVRHTEKATQSCAKSDTAVFTSSTDKEYHSNEKDVTAATETPRRGIKGFVWGMAATIAAIFVGAAVVVIKRKAKK